ncbi:MAG: hypothetical protein LUH40_03450 [Clostridiales bacterium]|nr:hypothetical protein [Clostridiales bacterium]
MGRDDLSECREFDEVLGFVSPHLRDILKFIPDSIKSTACEIRLRLNLPLAVCTQSCVYFVGKDSTVSSISFSSAELITQDDIALSMSLMCEYSVYSHQEDIAEGFVTFGSGHRAGFCGSYVSENGCASAIRDITSVNIRIARDCPNAADELIEAVYSGSDILPSIIIAGAPCTGKTTVLKNLAYRISSEYKLGFRKTAIIDERCELGSKVGVNCDILRGCSKHRGIEKAVRTLSPEMIICDEIGSHEEAEKIIFGLNTGAAFAVSIHADSYEDFLKRSTARELLLSGEFDYAVFLEGRKNPGKIGKIIRTDEIINEISGNSNYNHKLVYGGFLHNSSRQLP